jgi:hypothetical protein
MGKYKEILEQAAKSAEKDWQTRLDSNKLELSPEEVEEQALENARRRRGDLKDSRTNPKETD